MINIEDILSISDMKLRSDLILKGYLTGIHRVPYKGISAEFSQYREYTPGDDFDRIDWKVFLRTDKYYIKESEDETNTDAFIMLDMSRSMDFGNKEQYSKTLAVLLARIAGLQSDKTGYAFFSEEIVKSVNPSDSIRLARLISDIENISPHGRTDIGSCISDVQSRVRRNTFFILISDCADDPLSIINSLSAVRARGCDVILMDIIDRRELSEEVLASSRLIDMETGRIMDSAGASQMRSSVLAFKNTLKGLALDKGIDYQMISTDMPFYVSLNNFFKRRNR